MSQAKVCKKLFLFETNGKYPLAYCSGSRINILHQQPPPWPILSKTGEDQDTWNPLSRYECHLFIDKGDAPFQGFLQIFLGGSHLTEFLGCHYVDKPLHCQLYES